LLSMLAAGLIPAEMVRSEDFSEPAHQRLARCLTEGKSVQAFIDNINEDGEREQIMRALNYTPLPTERERALEVATEDLRKMRNQRDSQRSNQIKQSINKATPEQRAEIYRQKAAMWSESED